MTDDTSWRIPIAHEFVARDFQFHSGEVVPKLRLHYRVLGNPDGEPILVLHGTGGTGGGLLSPDFGDQLFGAGQPLDAARHFIVLPDAIGHGASAKPSDGMGATFPRYNYDDMVEGQYRVVTEALGIHHLRLVLGVSMGGYAQLALGYSPPVVHGRAASAGLPAGSDVGTQLVDAPPGHRYDPQWAQGNYTEQPASARTAWEIFSVAANGGTLALQKAAPSRALADQWLESRRTLPFATDANDLLYQWEASRDYDPSPGLDRIRAYVLAINSADDERNPPETGIAQQAVERLANGRFLLLAGSEDTRGHGTVGLAALWAQNCRAFLESVPLTTP